MLNAILPGAGYRVARTAAMSFTIEDGVIPVLSLAFVAVRCAATGRTTHGEFSPAPSMRIDTASDFEYRLRR